MNGDNPDEENPPTPPPAEDSGLHRRIFVSEIPDKSKAAPGGERMKEDVEYVIVPRKVKVKEQVTTLPVRRTYHEFEPKWTVQTIKRKVPKEIIQFEDNVTEVGHKRIVDEYVEVPYDAGTEIKCIPKVEIQERDIEVAVPRIKWIEKEEVIPEVREVVRYVEADHNIERVIRYIAESPPAPPTGGAETPPEVAQQNLVEAGAEGTAPPDKAAAQLIAEAAQQGGPGDAAANPKMLDAGILESPLQGVVLPQAANVDAKDGLASKAPVTVDIPVPFMVPRPLCIPVEVPLIRFRDNFVPVPGRRHVTPKLSFTDDVFDVPCAKEKPILVVQDYVKPVPVDCHIRVKEKDVRIKPMDPSELTQCDVHAMWMRANADLLEKYKTEHDNKYPRGYHGPEESKVPLKETDWEAVLKKEEEDDAAEKAAAAAAAPEGGAPEGGAPEGEGAAPPTATEDLGPLPLHPGHPMMMTFLQNQWIQNPTTTTHGMYTPDFFRHHYGALNAQLDPQCHQVNLTEDQMEKLGPMPHVQLPNPWKLVQKGFLASEA